MIATVDKIDAGVLNLQLRVQLRVCYSSEVHRIPILRFSSIEEEIHQNTMQSSIYSGLYVVLAVIFLCRFTFENSEKVPFDGKKKANYVRGNRI